MDKTEQWRPIEAHPRYEVSDHGRVRSWNAGGTRGPAGDGRREKPLILKSRAVRGYETVALWNGATQNMRCLRVHHLVLEAFVGPKPDPGMLTRHLDGNPENNKLDNLKWGTPIENSADTRRHRGVSDDEQIAAIIMARRGVPIRVLASALGYSYAAVRQWVVDHEGVDWTT